MAFDAILLFAGLQLGLAARALVVFHTPPPAAPMKTVQLDRLQFGSTAIAVSRPEKIVPAVAPVDSDATSASAGDRKSTRLNSSHVAISYAVFCLKKKKIK